MHICHFTTVHRKDDIRIYKKQICSLLQDGHTIYFAHSTFADGKIDPHRNLKTIPLKSSKKKFERIFNSLLLFNQIRKIPANIFHTHDPELIPVLLLLSISGKKTILDVHEDYIGQTYDKEWIPLPIKYFLILPLLRILLFFSKFIIHHFIVVTHTIAKDYPKKKTTVVQNFPLDSEVILSNNMKPISERRVHLSYFGAISEIRNFDLILEAYLELLEEGHKISFILGGRVTSSKIESLIKKCERYQCFTFLKWVDRKTMMEYLSDTRLGIVLFKPVKNHINAQPNKLFEYMSAGIPILASSFPLWKSIIDEHNTGCTIDPNNKEEIKKKIIQMSLNPSKIHSLNGRNLVKSSFNWGTEYGHLKKVYEVLNR